MSISLYDFDTRLAPFEAFASFGPCAPLALTAWFVAPVQWWVDLCLTTCGQLSETMLGAMVYPYAVPTDGHRHASDKG
ncbi:hypothetical protein [Dyella flagellata]|uniref:Uncharacterized protein n=1 Tax=Dyella flagellata TaxID=1867833 RepID=A0ABQ5XD76_9GAMM|nr:hypothetical protein [Dyella flagellata]GLQ89048.1 hypothetical protein GCM10007898_26200 [Dyella flagellata]